LINPAPPAGTPLDQIAVTRYVFAGTSDETLFTTQAVARIDLDVGRVQHALVTGVEWSRETSAPLFAFGIGVPGTSLLDPDSTQPLSATSLDPRIVAATDARTTALFALDTLKFSEQWQLTLGARWDAAAGAPLANAPEHSLNVWLNYRIASRFDTGLGARYVSEQFAQSAINGRMTPSYRTFDAMARYTLSDSLALKVNLTNLGNEFYFEQLHMWHIVPAAGRTVTFAVNAAY
jgi:outer membrane receptor for monomeric catechols